ncbi:hypothetical protein [Rhodococcus sp. NPDC004095]
MLGELWAFPFRVEVWGTVGQWISSILTAGSLALAWYVIFRDRRRVEREHVVKAMCWIEGSDGPTSFRKDVHFVNVSEQPVIRPRLVLVPKPRRKLDAMNAKLPQAKWISNMDRTSLLTMKYHFRKEDESVTFREDEGAVRKWIIPEMPLEMYDGYLVFLDANGEEWAKTVPGGEVISVRKLASINARMKNLAETWTNSDALRREIEELKRDNTDDIARGASED